MNFDIENCENICRVCLSKNPVTEISNDVCDKLKDCGGIDIEDVDTNKFPNKICHKCLINLEIAFEFREICQQSDKKLREVLRNSILKMDNHEDILGNLKVEYLAPKEEPDDIHLNEEYLPNNSQIGFNLNFDDSDTEEFIQNIQLDANKEESKFNPAKLDLLNELEKEDRTTPDSAEISKKNKVKGKYTKRSKDNKTNQRREKVKNTGSTIHKCEFCGINFGSRFLVENHMRLHSARLRFVCEICGDSYAAKFQLNHHMCSKHTGERNFKCQHCDKAFFCKASRNKHQKRSHSKLYKCGQCDKSFGRSDSLKKHMRVHTGEKPVVCDKCGTRFKELHHLKNHNKSMTPCILKMSIKVKDG